MAAIASPQSPSAAIFSGFFNLHAIPNNSPAPVPRIPALGSPSVPITPAASRPLTPAVDHVDLVSPEAQAPPAVVPIVAVSTLDGSDSEPEAQSGRRRTRIEFEADGLEVVDGPPVIDLTSDEPPPKRFKTEIRKRRKATRAIEAAKEAAEEALQEDLTNQELISLLKKRLTCPVCQCEVEDRALASTKCGHLFCLECIAQCVKVVKKCPTCRKSLTQTTGYHPIYF
jgi:hypothetical protein